MKKRYIAAATLALTGAGTLTGYFLGHTVATKTFEVQSLYNFAKATQGRQAELVSSDMQRVEHALWLKVADLRARVEVPHPTVSQDFTPMELAYAYARLSDLASSQKSEIRASALMEHAVAACKQTASPNCTPDKLLATVKRPQSPEPSAK